MTAMVPLATLIPSFACGRDTRKRRRRVRKRGADDGSRSTKQRHPRLLPPNDHAALVRSRLFLFLSYRNPGLRVKIPQLLLKGIEIGIQRATGTLTIHGQNYSE